MASELASAIHKKRCGKCNYLLLLSCFKERDVKGEKKLTSLCIKCLDKRSDYEKTPEGKASMKRCSKRYQTSDKGKATRKTYLESEAGKARQERMNDVAKKRRAKDPA